MRKIVGAVLAALVCSVFAGDVSAVCPAGPPALLTPANNSSLAFGPVMLDWSPVSGATSYDVYVGLDGGTPSLLGSTTATQKGIVVEPGRSVQWKVVAAAPSCAAQISGYFVFSTSCPSDAPQLFSPDQARTFKPGDSINFAWSSVAGAAGYDVRVTPDFGQTWTTIAENLADLSFTTAALPQGNWGWQVRANFNGSCGPLYSQPSSFAVTTSAAGCPTSPDKPAPIAPAPGATSLASPVAFSWSAVPGATEYRLSILMGTDVMTVSAGSQTSKTVDLRAGGGFWAVQAFFGENCPATVSERRAFTVSQGASCGTAAPQLITPANNAGTVNSPVAFQWGAVPGAIAYTLYLSTRNGAGDDFVAYGRTTAGTTRLDKLVPAGEVRWYVVAHFSGCPDTRSATFTFGSGTVCPAIASLPLVSPASGAEVSSPVTLSWTGAGTGREYRVAIETEGGASVIAQRTSNTSATFRLPVGNFAWRVDALGACPLSSERRTFNVRQAANCAANTAPPLVSPVGTQAQPAQAGSPVTLRWSGVPNAIAYRLLIGRNEEAFEESTLTAATQKELPLEPGRYRWSVNAIFENCPGVPSVVAYFVVARPGCATTAPTILSPQPKQVVQSAASLTWTPVEGAKRYRVIAFVAGELFLLGTTSSTSLTRILPPGAYSVVVETELEDCPSTRSAVTAFTVASAQNCATAPPELLSPANGESGRGEEADFQWSPVSGAIRYAVIARIGVGAETTLGTTQETHLVRSVPVGRVTWRVVAFFAGCAPTQSAERTFTVERPANCPVRRPSLLFPRGGDEAQSPVAFEIVRVPGATQHRIWVQRQGEEPSIASTTPGERVQLTPGEYQWFAEARFTDCPSTFSSRSSFITLEAVPVCGTPKKPDALVIGQAVSGSQYRLRWKPLANVSRYEVQESASADFAKAQTFLVDGLSRAFQHEVSGPAVQYLYRVRGLSDCDDAAGPFSDVVGVYIEEARTGNGSTELGEEASVVQTIFLPGTGTPRQFTATIDRPWLNVTPSSGTVPADGLTLAVTADPRTLRVGTNTGTVQVTYSSSSAGGVTTNDSSTASFPMSVSLVTPVMPSGKGTPPPDALIFAAVGHAAGVNGSFFESDIRLTNLTTQTTSYDLNFTPSGVDGTETGISTTVEVPPSGTLALDDVVATLFGSGTTGSALGMLEIRPLTAEEPSAGGLFGSITSSAIRQLNTAASSRTYNFTPTGTFGQFIPATRFADFVGRGSILSLQQVAESAQFRANFGFLEASGQPAELLVRVYDAANTLLSTIPVSLQSMQHRQIGNMLRAVGLTNLTDGRVEVEVVGGEGKVTAYVSEVDNATNDPLLVSAVVKGAVTSDRYVVPGMAYLNTGAAFWVSDLRVFNGGTSRTSATMIWVPQGSPASTVTRQITLEPGEIEVLNNVVGDTFGQPAGAGGAIVITTPEESTLTVTARTYNRTPAGTYGQYIVGVTPEQSIGREDRALQILQLEQSARIRSNVGVAETSGRSATVEISLITPDSQVTQVVTIGLAPNEFRQIGLVDFRPSLAVYNGRVTVKVIDGDGRVTAYGSAIDQITQDPTYVPAM